MAGLADSAVEEFLKAASPEFRRLNGRRFDQPLPLPGFEVVRGGQAKGRPEPAKRSPGRQRLMMEPLETAFQRTIISGPDSVCAHAGWWAHHEHRSQYGTSGWPDLVLVRERMVVAELKVRGNPLSKAQRHVIGLLHQAGVEVWVWRPGDMDVLCAVLARGSTREAGEAARLEILAREKVIRPGE